MFLFIPFGLCEQAKGVGAVISDRTDDSKHIGSSPTKKLLKDGSSDKIIDTEQNLINARVKTGDALTAYFESKKKMEATAKLVSATIEKDKQNVLDIQSDPNELVMAERNETVMLSLHPVQEDESDVIYHASETSNGKSKYHKRTAEEEEQFSDELFEMLANAEQVTEANSASSLSAAPEVIQAAAVAEVEQGQAVIEPSTEKKDSTVATETVNNQVTIDDINAEEKEPLEGPQKSPKSEQVSEANSASSQSAAPEEIQAAAADQAEQDQEVVEPIRSPWFQNNSDTEKQNRNKDSYGFITQAKKAIAIVGAVCRYCLGGYPIHVAGRERPLVKIDDMKANLEYSLDQQTDTQKSKSSGSSVKYDNSIMREQLNLQAKGDVFDPRLMSYVANGGFGLSQQDYSSDTDSESTSGDLLEYGFNANFLPVKPYPFSIGTSRSDQVVPRAFQSPLRVKDSHDNFNLSLRVPDWPMTFSWSQSDLTQNSDVGVDQYAFDRSTDRFSYNLTHNFSDYSRLTFRSDFDRITQTSGSSFNSDVKTQRHRLLHYLNFGDNKQNRLDTSFSFVDRKDQFDTTTFDWTENLFLRHSQNFSTFYNTVYSKNTFEDLDTQTITGLAGFTHQLYSNLTTTAQVYSSKIKFGSTSETTSQGGDVTFNYYRNNPLGLFKAEFEFYSSTDKTTGQTSSASVVDESHLFNDPFSFTLNEKNIDISTIVVTDATGLLVYTEGDDYTISEVGDEVQITPTTLGTDFPNISDGQILLVDYLYQVAGDQTEDTTNRRFRIEQQFNNGLSVYLTNQYLDREINSEVDPSLFGQTTEIMTYGAEYQYKRVTFIAERIDTDSTFQTTQSDRLAARTYWPLSPKTSLSGTLSHTWIDVTGENPRKSKLLSAHAQIRTRLSRYLSLSGRTEYRQESNTDIGPTNGYRIGTSLDYRRGSLNIRAGWDTYFLERSDTESDSTRFYLNLIRYF